MLIENVMRILSNTVAADVELRGVSVYQTKAGVSVTVYMEDGKQEESVHEPA